ncbi:MAG: GSU2403 family nucleotidyltransferase fold protein [Pseudonocardiaceae bacterium]
MEVTEPGAAYVLARKVLLDALEGLGDHRRAAVLVGAQAVYVHTGSGELTTAPMTTDADLLLRRSALSDNPTVDAAMRRAGFVLRPGGNPGQWVGEGHVGVDLMVVPHESGRSSPTARSVRMPPHDNNFARPTEGVQAALVDHVPHFVRSLDVEDARGFEVSIAGPAALITAKMIKIAERIDQPHRVRPRTRWMSTASSVSCLSTPWWTASGGTSTTRMQRPRVRVPSLSWSAHA